MNFQLFDDVNLVLRVSISDFFQTNYLNCIFELEILAFKINFCYVCTFTQVLSLLSFLPEASLQGSHPFECTYILKSCADVKPTDHIQSI